MDKWVGKTAVVTGAAISIGARIAEDLVASGLTVVGLDLTDDKLQIMRDTAKKMEKHRGKLVPYKCDIRNEDEVIKAFGFVENTFKSIDILVNNAGVMFDGFLIEMSSDKLRNQLETNVMGIVYCTRQAMKAMRHSELGHIIMVNSISGHFIPNFLEPRLNMYTVTKHAVTAMTKQLRLELLHANVRIKCTSVSPGLVDTSMSGGHDCMLGVNYLVTKPVMKPSDVSDVVMYVLSTPPNIHVHEIIFQALLDAH